jgi:hypothetical protein
MRRRWLKSEFWADVYREGTFAGRLYRLGPGEATRIDRVGSIIVGPKAVARIVTAGGREILNLPPGKLVKDISDLALPQVNTYLRVSKA